MNHPQIQQEEIVERYVQHRLAADERLAFQEHYFACDECFAQVQATARFVAGARQAARAGILDNGVTKAAAGGWANWFRPAFALTAFVALVLAVALGWLLLGQLPRLRGDLARDRQAREQIERENAQRLTQANEALANEKQQRDADRAKLEQLLAQNKPVPVPSIRSQANSPLVILDSVRGSSRSGDHQLVLGPSSTTATIWIEVEAGSRFDSYRLQIFDTAGHLINTVSGAKPNSYGAVAVTVPANVLHAGKYLVKLSGVKQGNREMVGEYDLNVRVGK
jgi:hypothetical protein